MEKTGKNSTGQSEKVTKALYFAIWGEAPSEPIETKIDVMVVPPR